MKIPSEVVIKARSLRMGNGVSVPAISIGRSVAKSTVCSIWHPKMRAMPSCAT